MRSLPHFAVEEGVAASTQNQAFNALLFLFRHALRRDLNVAGRSGPRSGPKMPSPPPDDGDKSLPVA